MPKTINPGRKTRSTATGSDKKPGNASDNRLLIVLGGAVILAVVIICAVIFTLPS